MMRTQVLKLRERIENEILFAISTGLPYRTGRLLSSWQVLDLPNGKAFINNTPYMVYTVEKWVSPQWRGRQNLHEQWVTKKIEMVLDRVAAESGVSYE